VKYNPTIVLAYWRECGLGTPELEYKFDRWRKWRFDFAWPQFHVALEVEGGIFTGGRHSRGAGMKKDMEKYNSAAALGWRVLRIMPQDLCMQDTVDMILKTIRQ